jgi:peptide/nickel transport system permease protein
VRFARAKGVSERRILRTHVLRNALLPIVTIFMVSLGDVLGGAVVVETVFSYPGLGTAIYEGVLARDYPLLQGALLLVAVVVVAANALADGLYVLIDPRVRRAGEVPR